MAAICDVLRSMRPSNVVDVRELATSSRIRTQCVGDRPASVPARQHAFISPLIGHRHEKISRNRYTRRSAAIPGKPSTVTVSKTSELETSATEDNQLVATFQDGDKAQAEGGGKGWGFSFAKILPFKRQAQGGSTGPAPLPDKLKQDLAIDGGAPQDVDVIISRACEIAAEYQEAWSARESKLVAELAAQKDRSAQLETERRQLVKKLESMANTSALRRMLSDAEALSQLAEESKAAQEHEAQRLSLELAAATSQLHRQQAELQLAEQNQASQERDAKRLTLELAAVTERLQREKAEEAQRHSAEMASVTERLQREKAEEAQRLSAELATATEQLQQAKTEAKELKTKLDAVAPLPQLVARHRDSLVQAATVRDAVTNALATVLAMFAVQSVEYAAAKPNAAKVPGMAARIAYLETALQREMAQNRKQLSINARVSATLQGGLKKLGGSERH